MRGFTPARPLPIPAGSSPSGLPPCSTNGLSSISHEYLKGSYSLDLEAVKGGASSLPHLNKTLVTSCKRLHRWVPGTGMDGRTDRRPAVPPAEPVPLSLPSEVDKVLAGLEILSKVFDQQSSPMVSKILQQVRGCHPPHPWGLCPRTRHGTIHGDAWVVGKRAEKHPPVLPCPTVPGGSCPTGGLGWIRRVPSCPVPQCGGGPALLGGGGGSRGPILPCPTVPGGSCPSGGLGWIWGCRPGAVPVPVPVPAVTCWGISDGGAERGAGAGEPGAEALSAEGFPLQHREEGEVGGPAVGVCARPVPAYGQGAIRLVPGPKQATRVARRGPRGWEGLGGWGSDGAGGAGGRGARRSADADAGSARR